LIIQTRFEQRAKKNRKHMAAADKTLIKSSLLLAVFDGSLAVRLAASGRKSRLLAF